LFEVKKVQNKPGHAAGEGTFGREAKCKVSPEIYGSFAGFMSNRDRGPLRKGAQIEGKIENMAFGGKGLLRWESPDGRYPVFVPHTLPGQRVRVRLVKAKRRYAEARLVKILERSEQEVDTPYVDTPGAPFLRWPLEQQQAHKAESVVELYRRIGQEEAPEKRYDGFVASPRSFHYRNKMEYSFSAVCYDPEQDAFVDDFALGFKKRGQWLAVEQLEGDSGLFDAQWEALVPRLRQWLSERGHTAWHPRKQEGFCRMVAVRKSYADDQLLINLLTSSRENLDQTALTEWLQAELGERLGGLLHTINDDVSDRPRSTDGTQTLLYGKPRLRERVMGLDFTISVESFFQTNPAAAEKLYEQVLDYVFAQKLPPGKVVLDLFSGTGTITQLLALRAPDAPVIGVEMVEEAVADARRNAKENGVKAEFVAADVGRFLLDHPQYQGQIDTLVMDPPRAGITPKTLRKVMRLEARRMVYVSCNPATQARDMEALREFGYVLKRFSVVDQFPHTAHVEAVALFERG
jgi:23S rRNA (uracil-5-)-methyltransferase RumA